MFIKNTLFYVKIVNVSRRDFQNNFQNNFLNKYVIFALTKSKPFFNS